MYRRTVRETYSNSGGWREGGVELLLAAGINSGGVDRLARFQNFPLIFYLTIPKHCTFLYSSKIR